jgi:hypothetical protein
MIEETNDRRKIRPEEEQEEEGRCPVPSAHDKLEEAHYFIHELIVKYHDPDEFRYSLSASSRRLEVRRS